MILVYVQWNVQVSKSFEIIQNFEKYLEVILPVNH